MTISVQQLEGYASLIASLGAVATQVVPVLFTTIDSIVQSVESVAPTAPGPQKLQAALTKAEAIFGDAVKVAPNIFTNLVNASVLVFNTLGAFKHFKAGQPSS